MSDEVKVEKVEVKEEVKIENKVEVIKEVKEVKEDYSDIFVTEDDTFEVTVKYYKEEGKILVEGIDETFDSKKSSKDIAFTLKYPSQSDCLKIASSFPKINADVEKVDIREFMAMELSRFFNLVRKWSINKKLSNEAIMDLNPKIIKGVLALIRNKIGMDGIF